MEKGLNTKTKNENEKEWKEFLKWQKLQVSMFLKFKPFGINFQETGFGLLQHLYHLKYQKMLLNNNFVEMLPAALQIQN